MKKPNVKTQQVAEKDPDALNDAILGDLERVTNPSFPGEVLKQMKSNIGPTDTPIEQQARGLNDNKPQNNNKADNEPSGPRGP